MEKSFFFLVNWRRFIVLKSMIMMQSHFEECNEEASVVAVSDCLTRLIVFYSTWQSWLCVTVCYTYALLPHTLGKIQLFQTEVYAFHISIIRSYFMQPVLLYSRALLMITSIAVRSSKYFYDVLNQAVYHAIILELAELWCSLHKSLARRFPGCILVLEIYKIDEKQQQRVPLS